jgi:hypothetical protein
MGLTRRRRLGVRIVVAVAFAFLFAPSSGTAGSLDACAQRVIRDWYSGGGVDGVYPLACYRAALRALPNDVLQYSNADQDIRRALAFARRGRNDPGNKAAAPAPQAPETQDRPTTMAKPPVTGKSPPPAAVTPDPAPVANEAASPVSKAPIVAETRSSPTSVPYPILALVALAGILLVAGGVGWLSSRGR